MIGAAQESPWGPTTALGVFLVRNNRAWHERRKQVPGSIVVDTDARYVYYLLPQGKAVRYGAIVGENGQAWPGVATVDDQTPR